MVESITNDNHLLPEEDDNLSPFINNDLLKHTMLFPSGKLFLHYYIYFILHISSKKWPEILLIINLIGNVTSFNIDDRFSVMKNSSESSENQSRPVSR